MAWLRLNEFEAAGFVSDVDVHLLQPQQTSKLENAHCVDGVLERYPGYKEFVLVEIPLIPPP